MEVHRRGGGHIRTEAEVGEERPQGWKFETMGPAQPRGDGSPAGFALSLRDDTETATQFITTYELPQGTGPGSLSLFHCM